ncbi:MAG: PEP-CTERM sorting domain-containing protein [Cyanothece sp. SIO2G6]|nr:PEP-CTERM sorting domain-containing protein [Cyanothece sp. SIO2G6]
MIFAAKKLVLGLPVVAGITVALVAPASAVTFSTSGSTIEFCSDGINTFADGEAGRSCNDSLDTILSGNSAAPGGNVELGGNDTEGISLQQFATVPASSLTADFGGDTITFSSLTYDDWFGVEGGGIDLRYGANNLANRWFADAFSALAASGSSLVAFGEVAGFNAFLTGNTPAGSFGTLFGRFSDPNIAYVNDDGSEYVFGLAGHKDAGQVLPILAGLTASEVVKVTYGGESEFLYSFGAPTDSGQVGAADGKSHNGNFEFAIAKPNSGGGILSESVPEPASILGLVAVGGLLAARKRLQK